MPGAEGAAPAVLAREADRRAFKKQRPERERFRVMPFVGTTRFENFPATIEYVFLDLRNDFEIVGHARQAIDNLLQHLGTDRGRFSLARVLRLKDRRRFL